MSFGESHGSAVGGVIDGCPAGIALSADFIQGELNRRRPGQSEVSTPRKEEDTVEILSGIFEGKSTGMPIGFLVRNQNQNSKDYNHLKDLYRPSHADYTWEKKYGIRDYRGGGLRVYEKAASARRFPCHGLRRDSGRFPGKSRGGQGPGADFERDHGQCRRDGEKYPGRGVEIPAEKGRGRYDGAGRRPVEAVNFCLRLAVLRECEYTE